VETISSWRRPASNALNVIKWKKEKLHIVERTNAIRKTSVWSIENEGKPVRTNKKRVKIRANWRRTYV
jgi:hypothetical protein